MTNDASVYQIVFASTHPPFRPFSAEAARAAHAAAGVQTDNHEQFEGVWSLHTIAISPRYLWVYSARSVISALDVGIRSSQHPSHRVTGADKAARTHT
jgi:hypothetical protein